jgi:hypothetical protein
MPALITRLTHSFVGQHIEAQQRISAFLPLPDGARRFEHDVAVAWRFRGEHFAGSPSAFARLRQY